MLLANLRAPVIEAPNCSVPLSDNWTVEVGLMAVAVPSVNLLPLTDLRIARITVAVVQRDLPAAGDDQRRLNSGRVVNSAATDGVRLGYCWQRSAGYRGLRRRRQW